MPQTRRSKGSDTITDGFRVRVEPSFLPERSEPADRQYVFAYRIEIINDGAITGQLLNRHWDIVDAASRRHEVDGPGVVGYQPTLAPGERFAYESFCPLPTPWGTMEGWYEFRRVPGPDEPAGADDLFRVRVGRFYLVADES